MDILHSAVLGDKQAFTELYKQYRQEIFSFLLGRIANREDALDLTSDVFLAAYSGIASFQENCSFRTWLYAITKHKLNDYYIKKGLGRQNIYSIDEASENASPDVLLEAANDSDDLAQLETDLDLKTILKKLLPVEQEILLLHDVNGLKFVECAQALNITEGYARVFHQRALKKASDFARSIV